MKLVNKIENATPFSKMLVRKELKKKKKIWRFKFVNHKSSISKHSLSEKAQTL